MVKRKKPIRKCTGCQESKDKRDLIRVVKTPEGDFVIDSTGKKNGRGAYICPSMACLEKAIKNKGLERSFKQSIPEDIYASLKEVFTQFDVEE